MIGVYRSETMMKKHAFLLFVIGLLLGPLIVAAQNESSSFVQHVVVSNETASSVKVCWVTVDLALGGVKYSYSEDFAGSVFVLEESPEPNIVHCAVVVGLYSDTPIYFDIEANGYTDNNNEQHYTATTAVPIGPPPVKPAFLGQIFDYCGNPVEGALVTFQIVDEDGLDSLGRSTISTAITTAGGYYLHPGVLRSEDLLTYFDYSLTADSVQIGVILSVNEQYSFSVDLEGTALLPVIELLDDPTSGEWPTTCVPEHSWIAKLWGFSFGSEYITINPRVANIPGGSEVDRILLEIVVKFVSESEVPESVIVTTANQTLQLTDYELKESVLVYKTWIQPADWFTVYVDGDGPEGRKTPRAILAHTFTEVNIDQASIGSFIGEHLYKNEVTRYFDLPSSFAGCSIQFQTAIADVENDTRFITLTVMAGNQVLLVEDIDHPNMGDELELYEAIFQALPPGIAQLSVTLTSPNQNGDSVYWSSATLQAQCDENSETLTEGDDEDLLAYYTFLEGNGDIVHDLSNNGPVLDLQMNTVVGFEWVEEGGLLINNESFLTAGSVGTQLSDSLQGSNAWTVEAIIKPQFTSIQEEENIFTFWANPDYASVALNQTWIDGETLQFSLIEKGTQISMTEVLSDTYSMHEFSSPTLYITVVKESSGVMVFYLNGERVAVGETAVSGHHVHLTIGDNWTGIARLFALYNRNLADDEIQQKFLTLNLHE